MPKILSPTDVIMFRQRLCDLALKAFAERGLDGISLRGLAAEAGCSRTTPYRYFKNKADILAAVRQSEFKRMADAAELAIANEPSPDRKLTALAKSYIQFAMDRPEAYRVMYQVVQKDEQRYPDLVAEIRRAQQPMLSAVNLALDSGSIEGDPINIVHVLWAGMHGLVSLHLSEKLHMGRDIKELTEVMVRALSRSISTAPSPEPAACRITE